MQIFSWNIRGLGILIKKRFLSKLIKKRKHDMVLVQETKLEAIDSIAIRNIWGGNNIEFSSSSSVGVLGGLLILWKKDF